MDIFGALLIIIVLCYFDMREKKDKKEKIIRGE